MNERKNKLHAEALQQAVTALRTGQFRRAEHQAAAILKANRTDRSALLILAHALLRQHRADEAIAPLEKAANRTSDPEIETLLGAALCDARRGADGIARLRVAAARRPPYLPAFQELAGRLAKAARLGEAISVIEQGLALAPASIDLKVDLARLCVQASDREKARENLAAARDAAPGRADILAELGLVLFLDGAYAEAADTFRNALGLRPDDPQSRANLAMCLLELGQRDGAETALRSMVRGRPHLVTRAAHALAGCSHGRFFFRISAAAKFLEADTSAMPKR